MKNLWIKFIVSLKKIKLAMLDVFFPINCLDCGAPSNWLCESCQRKIKRRDQQLCPVCEKNITPDGQVCFACKKKTALTGLLVATSYQQPLISKTVHLFKYRFLAELALPLAELILQAIQTCELPLPDLIIPIPLHPRRLRWRGFNQATLLAQEIANKLLPEVCLEISTDTLIRQRYTLPQMTLKDHRQRNANIQNAFVVTDATKIKNKRILLIDDITTTGSTIFECARVLKKAGAKEIYAAVIARQEYKQK